MEAAAVGCGEDFDATAGASPISPSLPAVLRPPDVGQRKRNTLLSECLIHCICDVMFGHAFACDSVRAMQRLRLTDEVVLLAITE